jgi:hypothetical protein
MRLPSRAASFVFHYLDTATWRFRGMRRGPKRMDFIVCRQKGRDFNRFSGIDPRGGFAPALPFKATRPPRPV